MYLPEGHSEPDVNLGGILTSLVAFTAFHRASIRGLSSVSKLLGRHAGRLIRQLGAAPRAQRGYKAVLGQAISRSNTLSRIAGGPAVRNAGLSLGQMARPLTGELLGIASSRSALAARGISALRGGFRQVRRERIKYFRGAGLKGVELRRATRGRFHPGDMDMRRKLFSRYFKADGGFSKRFMGSATKWGAKYAKTIPGFYIADQALGLFSQERRQHSPAFYDIPGHMAGMVRFGISFAPFDMAFRGLGAGLSHTRAGLAEGARRYISKRPGAKQNIHKLFSTEGVLGNVRATTKAFGRAYVERRRMGWGVSLQPLRFNGRSYNVFDMVRRGIELRREIGRPVFGLEAEMKQIMDQVQAVKTNVGVDPELFRVASESSAVRDAFGRLLGRHTRAPRQTMLAHAMEYAPKTKTTFQFVDDYAKNYKWTGTETDHIKKMLGDKRLYFGTNVLEQGNFGMLSGAYLAEKLTDTIGRARVPIIGWAPWERWALQRKMGAFEVIDDQRAILQAADHPLRGVDRVVRPHQGESYLRVGDTMFSVSPFNVQDPIRPIGPPAYKGRGKMVYLTAGERSHLAGTEEIREKRSMGWFSRVRQKFELGYDSSFVGTTVKRWLTKDFDPRSAHVLTDPRLLFSKLVRGGDPLTSETFGEFKTYMSMLRQHFQQSQTKAFGVLEREGSLRNKILDIIGVPEARRTFRDDQMESLFVELRGMVNSPSDIRNPMGDRLNKEINRSLGMVQSSKDVGYVWNSRASSVSEANAITTGEWLKGQYFTKLLEEKRSLRTGQIHPEILNRLFSTVEGAQLSKVDSTVLKGLFTGTSVEGSISRLASTSQGAAAVDVYNDLRSTVIDHWGAIQDVFGKPAMGRSPFRTLYDSNARVSRELGSGMADNRIWLFDGKGRKSMAPGFFEDMKKRILGQPGIGPEPFVTQNSLRFNRWAISPLNRTLGIVGLDLTYQSNAEFIRKFIGKRALAIPGAIYGYRAMDTAVSATPFLDSTILDDGVTVAGADVIAKANLTRAGLFDNLGVTSASRYLEGLLPGSVESPAAKVVRAAVPPMIGRYLGGRGGFIAGLGVSALTGFGLPDLTRSKEELEDIYTGRELVPVRKGRFWELCVTEDALIRTTCLLRQAKDITTDDVLLDSDGNSAAINEISSRDLEPGERILELVPKFFPEYTLRCTSDHKIMVSRRGHKSWIPAGKIKKSDHLVFPLRDFDSEVLKSQSIEINMRNTYNLGMLMGSYVSTGGINGEFLDLDFAEDRLDVALSICGLIEECFSFEPKLLISSYGCTIRSPKGDLSNFLWTVGRFDDGTLEKFYHVGQDFRNGFIAGMIECCGGLDREDRLHIVIVRKDASVVLYVIDALLSMGVISEHSSIQLFTDGEDKTFDRFVIQPQYLELLMEKCKRLHIEMPDTIPPRNLKEVYIAGGNLYHPISEIREIPYSGKVYDFWVGAMESFCSPFGIYHNSKGPFAGGRITSWLPSWYTRIKSQYRYTDAALGTKMEAMLYTGPLAAVGATDPYHYERCVAEGSPVIASKGICNVEELSPSDKVLTHEGTYRRIIDIWSKTIDEEVISLHTISLPVTTTQEHRYLVQTRSGRSSWERADQLGTDDWMRTPSPIFGEKRKIDLSEFLPNVKADAKFLYPKKGDKFRRWINLDTQFGLLIGLFMSRLRYGDNPFNRAAHRVDGNTKIQRLLRTLMVHCFDMSLSKAVINPVYQAFMRRFGTKWNPCIPKEFFMVNREFCWGVLRGTFMKESGFLKENYDEHWDDRNFVLHLLRMLLAFGIYATIHEWTDMIRFKLPKEQKKNLQCLFLNKMYTPHSDTDVRFQSDEIQFRIQRIERENYIGRIYDLEIEGAHSFHGDCCVYHNTRFKERPYPLTAPPFHNVPVIGPALNATVGQIVKPQRMMHEDELNVAYLGMEREEAERIAPGVSGPQLLERPRGADGMFMGRPPMKTTSLQYAYGESLYRFTEAIGLRGFLTQTMLGEEGANRYDPVWEDASSITSHAKQFWDMQLGGAAGLSEGIRRFYPRERSLNLQNPLRNTQPHWLPSEFQYGDAIGRADSGLLLLPSRAYEATHNIRHNFPLVVDHLGYDPREQALRYTAMEHGDPIEVYHDTPMKEYVQNQLTRTNRLAAKDVPAFDPINLIEGEANVMIRMGEGLDIPMQIKASTAETLGGMTQPMPAHVAQLNFLLRMLKKRMGQITYVAVENPDLQKTFNVEYSQERFQRDLAVAGQARELASKMLRDGVGYGGESYSYPDRLVVLANNAPWSKEYKDTLKKLKALQRHGQLDAEDTRKLKQAQRMRNSMMRQYDLYPRRFSFGKLLTPDTEYNLMSENLNIKAASEYSLFERVIGSIWEEFSTTRIPFVSRFYGIRTPEQMYEDAVFGSTASMWSHPIRDFANPALRSFIRSDDPVEAARKGATFGALFGGPPGAAVGMALGGLYGAARSPFDAGVPSEIRERRDVTTYFDAIKYIKGTQLYAQTGDPAHLDEAKSTVFGIDKESTSSQLYNAVPYKERPFLWIFGGVTDSGERRRILQKVSPTMGRVLQFIWNNKRGEFKLDVESYTARNQVPALSWEGWNADVPVDDVQLVTLDHEGANAYDYGLGWHDQRRRMHTNYTPDPINLSHAGGQNVDAPNLSQRELRHALYELAAQHGIMNPNIQIVESGAKGTTVNLLVRVSD